MTFLDVVPLLTSKCRDLIWPGQFFSKSGTNDVLLAMQNFSSIRRKVRRPFQKEVHGGHQSLCAGEEVFGMSVCSQLLCHHWHLIKFSGICSISFAIEYKQVLPS